MASQFDEFKGLNPDCPKCHGEGSYMYDNNHGKICELCCTHPKGFQELDPKWWPHLKGKVVCVFGCGETKDV